MNQFFVNNHRQQNPFLLKSKLRAIYKYSVLLYKHFGCKHFCPICGIPLRNFAIFKTSPRRPGRPAECPFCHSLERTRAIWLYFANKRLLSGQIRMLHVAPESSIEKKLRKLSNVNYITLDLNMHADICANLTKLPFASNFFNLIYCSNVLEHIDEDFTAMTELYRVLQPDGLAIIQVPIKGEMTFEDNTVISPDDRDRLFGQYDHVRYYGRDIKCRLEKVGFYVNECWMPDAINLPQRINERYGIAKPELLHLCYKK